MDGADPRRPQGRLRHARGDPRRRPAPARDLRRARDPRHVLLHARARPLRRRRPARLHAQGLPGEDAPLARAVALRLADDALRDAPARAADRRALRRRAARRGRGGPRDRRARLGPRRLARPPRPDDRRASPRRSYGRAHAEYLRDLRPSRARERRAGLDRERRARSRSEEERSLLYTSDTRGGAPFFPSAGGRVFRRSRSRRRCRRSTRRSRWPQLRGDAAQRVASSAARGARRHAGPHDPRGGRGRARRRALFEADPRRLARGRRAVPARSRSSRARPSRTTSRSRRASSSKTRLPGRGGHVATGWPRGPHAADPRRPRLSASAPVIERDAPQSGRRSGWRSPRSASSFLVYWPFLARHGARLPLLGRAQLPDRRATLYAIRARQPAARVRLQRRASSRAICRSIRSACARSPSSATSARSCSSRSWRATVAAAALLPAGARRLEAASRPVSCRSSFCSCRRAGCSTAASARPRRSTSRATLASMLVLREGAQVGRASAAGGAGRADADLGADDRAGVRRAPADPASAAGARSCGCG